MKLIDRISHKLKKIFKYLEYRKILKDTYREDGGVKFKVNDDFTINIHGNFDCSLFHKSKLFPIKVDKIFGSVYINGEFDFKNFPNWVSGTVQIKHANNIDCEYLPKYIGKYYRIHHSSFLNNKFIYPDFVGNGSIDLSYNNLSQLYLDSRYDIRVSETPLLKASGVYRANYYLFYTPIGRFASSLSYINNSILTNDGISSMLDRIDEFDVIREIGNIYYIDILRLEDLIRFIDDEFILDSTIRYDENKTYSMTNSSQYITISKPKKRDTYYIFDDVLVYRIYIPYEYKLLRS